MYDKISIILPRTSDNQEVEKYLSDGKQQTNIITGEVCTFGCLDSLKVSVKVGSIYIVGSLAKYLYPNNIYPLDRHSTKEAIEKLSDSLHIDVTEAKVTSIEFGTQYIMQQPPTDYIALLGDMPRLTRLPMDSSLYFKPRGKLQPKTFVFYDKKADAKAKGMVLPVGFEGANLLKYEMRLKGRLPQQLNVPEVTASTLYDPNFYRALVKRYQESYFSITKKQQLKTNIMCEIKTVTDALDVLFARLISQSNQEDINGFVEDLKRSKVFKDAKYYTRLKRKIQETANKGGVTVSNDLIKELDDCIKNACAYT